MRAIMYVQAANQKKISNNSLPAGAAETPQSSALALTRLRALLGQAYERAPAIRSLLDAAGMRPDAILTLKDLAAIPVTKKESLVDLQRAAPPFGGLCWAEPGDIERIYISPGPIHEPQLRGDRGHRGCVAAFSAAGIGVGDVVLNTWAYQMVPAGLVYDGALRALGACVLPTGTGNTEQQARLIADLSVTVIVASTAYFIVLMEKLEELGLLERALGHLRLAHIGGEFGDWMGKRRALEQRYGFPTSSLYGTGDLGAVAYEEQGAHGLRVHDDRIVQICDPESGQPVPTGDTGEIVVTSLTPGWGLVRLGTGDLTHATQADADGYLTRLAPLRGRMGLAVKAREIFIYPQHVEATVARSAGVTAAQVRITRPQNRDLIEVRVALAPSADAGAARESAHRIFLEVTRLRADEINVVNGHELADAERLVVDARG